ncbi:hypothetical protein MMC14_000597 [Varicellaria rhodocarpa]|nr:hypothetical protein [Varicellaria rhodocarpa]
MATPTHIHDLPNEILFDVFGHSFKSDLKLFRLVCGRWSDVAIPLLYDRIYISIGPHDLDVFRQWMNHDLCRKAIKSLIVDFQPIDSSLSLVELVEHALPSLVWSPQSTATDYEKIDGYEAVKLLDLVKDEEGHPFNIKTSRAAVAYGGLIEQFGGEKSQYDMLVDRYQSTRA